METPLTWKFHNIYAHQDHNSHSKNTWDGLNMAQQYDQFSINAILYKSQSCSTGARHEFCLLIKRENYMHSITYSWGYWLYSWTWNAEWMNLCGVGSLLPGRLPTPLLVTRIVGSHFCLMIWTGYLSTTCMISSQKANWYLSSYLCRLTKWTSLKFVSNIQSNFPRQLMCQHAESASRSGLVTIKSCTLENCTDVPKFWCWFVPRSCHLYKSL